MQQRVPLKKITENSIIVMKPKGVAGRFVTIELTAGCADCDAYMKGMYLEVCEEPGVTTPSTQTRE